MYTIDNINYHYYYQLTDALDLICMDNNCEVVQMFNFEPSGDSKLMHRVTVLFKQL